MFLSRSQSFQGLLWLCMVLPFLFTNPILIRTLFAQLLVNISPFSLDFASDESHFFKIPQAAITNVELTMQPFLKNFSHKPVPACLRSSGRPRFFGGKLSNVVSSPDMAFVSVHLELKCSFSLMIVLYFHSSLFQIPY